MLCLALSADDYLSCDALMTIAGSEHIYACSGCGQSDICAVGCIAQAAVG